MKKTYVFFLNNSFLCVSGTAILSCIARLAVLEVDSGGLLKEAL